jgi:CRP-like cAMP-binding protein
MIKIMLEYLGNLRQIKRSFRQDQYLFHRDDRVKSMFLIETGTAQLLRHHPNGTAVVLQRAGPGSILAEASLFTPKYHCDAIATSPMVACLISRTAMQQLFFTNQDFAKAWALHLAGEVRGARLRSEILTLKTVSERLDAWLADSGHLPEKGGWKAIAQEIGTSPEALYREIARRRQS